MRMPPKTRTSMLITAHGMDPGSLFSWKPHALYLRPDCLDAGQQEVVMEGEGAAYLRHDQPEDREPPEPVHGADLGADNGDGVLTMMGLTLDME